MERLPATSFMAVPAAACLVSAAAAAVVLPHPPLPLYDGGAMGWTATLLTAPKLGKSNLRSPGVYARLCTSSSRPGMDAAEISVPSHFIIAHGTGDDRRSLVMCQMEQRYDVEEKKRYGWGL